MLQGKQLKTPKVQIFGVFVWLLFGWVGPVAAECPVPVIDETARVAYVFDGDTLRLTDGRRVRVLGINTPELSHDGRVEQPLGQVARDAAREFFPKNSVIRLAYDQQRKDRYGRILAHTYNAQNQSLATMLLRKGLAFPVVVPPNVLLAECLASQMLPAQTRGLGVWREQYWQEHPSISLKPDGNGFMRVTGNITKVTVKRDVWLELDGPLVVKIASADRHYFGKQDWQSWHGKRMQLRGWVINRAGAAQHKKGFKSLRMQLRHPAMLHVLN